ncbi:Prenylcysteine lyase-domain-containing protein [Aspergillus karnatakaensis]|uniref:putative prenylcysteine lyase n=1 Tax=Aspergillus karnatakaensis TaxID=1810916 RepID=UPI003CCD3DBD
MDRFYRSSSLKWCLFIWTLLYATALAFIPLPKFNGGQTPLKSPAGPVPKQVAVIGAGAAGASTAYNLRKYADSLGVPLNITVFERSSYVGGRSTTVDVFGDPTYPIELGGSIFVKVNYNLVNASKELGLNVQGASVERPEESAETLGVWDGEQFVFVMQDSSSWWDIAKLIWRYGLAPIRTQNLMKSTVNKFLQLYTEPIFPFKSLTAAAASVGLLDSTSTTGATFLEKYSVSSDFARELIQASTRVNYGQNLPLIHGLESMVCMATDGAVSVEGGNWRIFDGMLKAAQADLRLNHTVTTITRNSDNSVSLNIKEQRTRQRNEFDEVVIAGPYQYSGLDISPAPEHIPDTVPFHTLHVTLFSSPHRLSGRYFNLKNPSDLPPETILTTLPRGTDLGNAEEGVGPAGFWSISTLRTVPAPTTPDPDAPKQHYVYKIFSPARPTANFIRDIFALASPETKSTSESSIADLPKEDISWYHEKVWHPYPFLYPRVTFEDPLLAPRIWYTGGIESFISTMETSALMGKNVAALIAQGWQDEDEDGEIRGLDDAPIVEETDRGEL